MLFRLSKFFLYASTFAVVIVSLSTLFPFIVGKYAYFRAMVDLALICFFAGLLFSPGAGTYLASLKERFRSPVVIAVTVFTAVFLLAGFFGVRPSFSFWSNFERGEGGLQMLHFYVLFVLLATLFRKSVDWRRLFWMHMIAAALVILYGVLAGFGTSLGGWGSAGPAFGSMDFRFQGAIGNAGYVASYLLFMLFFAACLLLDLRARRRLRSRQTLALAVLAAAFLVFIFMSGTRGGVLGFIVGGMAALAYAAYRRKEWRKRMLTATVLALLVLGIMFHFRSDAFIEELPGGRIFSVSLEEPGVRDRLIMWQIAFEGWKERPLLGWGPENFLPLFDRHFDPRYFHPEAGFGAWFDRAHSIYFDHLAQTGILGLASYLGIFVSLALLIFKKGEGKAPAAPFFVWILAAYLVQGLVLFDVLPLYLPLFTIFAFAVFYFTPADGPRRDTENVSE